MTELTTPRITEPAGIIVRSPSFEIDERRRFEAIFNSRGRRAERLLQPHVQLGADRNVHPRAARRRDGLAEPDEEPLELEAARLVPRACERTLSMRSRISKYSARGTVSFFLSLTLR